MRPDKTMHRAEHRVEDIAIKAGKTHSLLVDTVFPYAFGRFLSLGSRLPGVVLNLLRYRKGSLGCGETPLSTQRIAGRFRRRSIKGASAQTLNNDSN